MYLSQILTKMYRTYKIKAIIYKENIKQDRSKWSSIHYYSWMGRFNTIIISIFLILIYTSNAHISEHSVSKRRYEKMKSSATGWGAKKMRKEDEDEFDFRHVEFEVPVGHRGTEHRSKWVSKSVAQRRRLHWKSVTNFLPPSYYPERVLILTNTSFYLCWVEK